MPSQYHQYVVAVIIRPVALIPPVNSVVEAIGILTAGLLRMIIPPPPRPPPHGFGGGYFSRNTPTNSRVSISRRKGIQLLLKCIPSSVKFPQDIYSIEFSPLLLFSRRKPFVPDLSPIRAVPWQRSLFANRLCHNNVEIMWLMHNRRYCRYCEQAWRPDKI